MLGNDLTLALIFCVQLGSAHFQERRQAEDALYALGVGATPVVYLFSKNADPEVRARTHRLLTGHRAQQVAVLAERHPWLRIDALPPSYPGREALIASLVAAHWDEWQTPGDAEEVVQRPFRKSVRSLIVLLIHRGHSPDEVAALLDKMAARQTKSFNAEQCVWLEEAELRDSRTGDQSRQPKRRAVE